MRFQNIILIFSIYFFTRNIKFSHSKVIKKRDVTIKNKDCNIYGLRFEQCGLQVSRHGNERFKVAFMKTCTIRDMSFVYVMERDNAYMLTIKSSKAVVTISEMKKSLARSGKIFEAGTHFVSATMTAKSLKNEEMTIKSTQCQFYVRNEPATAILGLTNRSVRANKSFTVDASRSMNNDLERRHVGLEYTWTCTSTNDYCENITDLGTANRVRVPAEYVTQGDMINFTVQVRSIPTGWQSAVQIFTIDDNSSYVVNCIERCGKYPNTFTPNDRGWLEVKCQFNCELYNENWLWGATFRNTTGELTGSWPGFKTKVRLITDHASDSAWNISVFYGNPDKSGMLLGGTIFTVLDAPKVKNCKTEPASGKALEKFNVTCDYDRNTTKQVDVKVKVDGEMVYSTSSHYLEDIQFSVPGKNASVAIKVTNLDDVYTEVETKVDITPLLTNTENITAAVAELTATYDDDENYTSIQELFDNNEAKEALQFIETIARELADLKAKNREDAAIINELKKRVLADISKVPITDVDLALSVSGVLRYLAKGSKDDVSDSEMAKILAETCSNLAKQQFYLVENDVTDDISQEDNEDIIKNLMTCGESEMLPYYEMFEEQIMMNITNFTTEFPINENLSEGNFEDYPQYTTDDTVEQKVNEFLSAAESMISICRDMALAFLHQVELDMIAPNYISRPTGMLAFMKSKGTWVAKSTFEQYNVTLKPSHALENWPKISIQVCSYEKDPFWSLSNNHKIPTNVIDVKLIDEYTDGEIVNFDGQPMNISFHVFESLLEKIITTIALPLFDKNYELEEEDLKIFLIKARGLESFYIEFHDLEENDHFQAIVKEMERPQLKDFDDPTRVSFYNTKIFITHSTSGDKYFLLAVSPNRKFDEVVSEKSLKFSVYTPRCVAWDPNRDNWKFACSIFSSTNNERIDCQCLHLSTLAGDIEYNELKENPKYRGIEFALQDEESLFFIVVLCSLLLIYFYLLLYSIQKNETIEDAVYLMSDVPAENRFAYLVIVKTGRRIHSGTTSNIVIRLFGTKNRSQEHVINFPDPNREFLQSRQEDFFVLATPVHLGELLKIHVWFDSTGMQPTWFCQDFRIYDMQTKTWYFFEIDEWFTVEGKSNIFMSVVISTEKQEAKQNAKRSRLLRSFLSFGRINETMWHLSTSSPNINFGFPKRLTLILSVVLSLLTLSIQMHGRPEFMARDSITPNCYFTIDGGIFWKGISSALVTFFPHWIIMEGFKRSRLQFQSRKSKDSKPLPAVLTIIFWCILTFNILAQVHYLLFYGFRIIQPTTFECIFAAVVGFLFYIFILEYLINLLKIFLSGPFKSVRYNYEKILKNVEEQRRVLYKFIGRYIYRPILVPLYEIMHSAEIRKKNIHFRQLREMKWQVYDFFVLITFILLLYVIILGDKDTIYDYRGHDQAVKLVEGVERNKHKLENVTHVKDFEDFMEKSLIPSIQSPQWYGKYVSDSPGMTSDAANKYIGVMRLRQHRVEDDSCVILEPMKFMNITCRAPNYFQHFDGYNYTPSWNAAIPEFHRSRLGSVWGHQTDVGKPFYGVTGYYGSGGYVAVLGRTIQNSYVNFDYLRRKNWFDTLTRGVVVEFALYNVNLNNFHFVELVLEKGATGYVSKITIIQTERVMTHSTITQQIAMVCCIIFMLMVLAMAVITLIRIVETRVWFKSDYWHIVDIIISVSGFVWIVLFFTRLAILRDFAMQIEGSRANAFVNYFPILSITHAMKNLEGFLLFLSTVRMWRILRFGTTFRTVERTLAYSAESLLYLGLYYLIFLVAFSVPIYVILGPQVEHFNRPYFVFKTLILNSIHLMPIKLEEVEHNDRGLGYVFFVLYTLIGKFFMTVFIAIILVEYIKARKFAFKEVLDYNWKDYTREKYKVFKRRAFLLSRKFRLTAGARKRKPAVSPKPDDLRYKNCAQIDSNRLKAMACVMKCVLLKLKKGVRVNETDQALMMRTVKNLCGREDGKKEIFFIETTKGRGFVIVDNRRLLLIEGLVNLMLESPEVRAKKNRILTQEQTIRAANTSRMMKMSRQIRLMCEVIKNIEIEILSELEDD